MKPYYDAGGITIYLGDCREVLPKLEGGGLDALVTDPPYGINWTKGLNLAAGSRAHGGIAGDQDTAVRDAVLDWWGIEKPAIVFGSVALPPPANLTQTLIWHKPADAGVVGCVTGFRRDVEAIYLCGRFPRLTARWSSVLRSGIANVGSPNSPAGETGHPHAKPVDLMARLNDLVPGVILDPFMGSGSTLRAAKDFGRRAIGIEVDEKHCETAVARLGQEALPV